MAEARIEQGALAVRRIAYGHALALEQPGLLEIDVGCEARAAVGIVRPEVEGALHSLAPGVVDQALQDQGEEPADQEEFNQESHIRAILSRGAAWFRRPSAWWILPARL